METCRQFESNNGNYSEGADPNYELFLDSIVSKDVKGGKSWELADRVLFPIRLGDESTETTHYMLPVLSLAEHLLEIYDSVYGERDPRVMEHVDSYSEMIPSLLELINFHRNRPSYGDVYEPLEVKWVKCPKQANVYDCGAFVIRFADLLMDGKNVSKYKFSQLRQYWIDFATNLWCHATSKVTDGYETPPEIVGHDYHEHNLLTCPRPIGAPFLPGHN